MNFSTWEYFFPLHSIQIVSFVSFLVSSTRKRAANSIASDKVMFGAVFTSVRIVKKPSS